MIKLEYTVQFLTPAFLGNAEQVGQWRTPPFKAQLRQWWRVAYGARRDFKVDESAMRRDEGLLFGNAWLENQFCKSLVRIRLDNWDIGKLKSWDGLEQKTVHHREAEKAKYQVGPHAYLGYGPLDGRGGTKFAKKENAAIQPGEQAKFMVAIPEEQPELLQALWLMDRFGTLGGRSRNGWGSFTLTATGETPALNGTAPLVPWRDGLKLDWPHALGQDDEGRALIWQTTPFDDWKALMRQLAVIKIGLRTQFSFPHARPDGEIHDRHWLSYPITRHDVKSWGRNARLPNSLRFKVRPAPSDPMKLVGTIFHVPCLPPPQFKPDPKAIQAVWQKVHGFLDATPQQLTRIPA